MFAEAVTPNTGQSVTGAIRQAAKATGTNFQYLLAAAKVESNLDPAASARSSSAGGLFQFIDQTWLGTLKQSGASLGYGKYADAIRQTGSGRYVVADPALRKQIMALRKDPAANAAMAGAFTQANANYLTQKLGREPTEGELYIAHFLGARGAAKLIGLAGATPNAIAKDAFPKAAGANRSIFFGEQGRPRTFAEVTGALSNRYDVARATQTETVAPAVAATPAETARVAQAYAVQSPAVAAPMRVALADDTMFSNPYRNAPAKPAVAAPAPAPRAPATVAPTTVAPAQAVEPTRPAGSNEPLGLFQDMKPNVRALFTGG